jgi:hypothetical protein
MSLHQEVSAVIAEFGRGAFTLADFHVLLNFQEMTGKFLHEWGRNGNSSTTSRPQTA